MKYDLKTCRFAMSENGYTQTILARRIKLAVSTVNKFLKGGSVRDDTAHTIITGLGLRVRDVLVRQRSKERTI